MGRHGMAYLHESASVCDGGLLAHLLHDFGLCVHFKERLRFGFWVRVCVGVWGYGRVVVD